MISFPITFLKLKLSWHLGNSLALSPSFKSMGTAFSFFKGLAFTHLLQIQHDNY